MHWCAFSDAFQNTASTHTKIDVNKPLMTRPDITLSTTTNLRQKPMIKTQFTHTFTGTTRLFMIIPHGGAHGMLAVPDWYCKRGHSLHPSALDGLRPDSVVYDERDFEVPRPDRTIVS